MLDLKFTKLPSSRHYLLGACMMHVEGAYSTVSRSFLHCNPGNIMDDEHQERTYPTHLAGYEALVTDICANIGSEIGKFIAKYAPPVENNTSFYLQEVCELTGFAATDLI